jgi:hypothetical protein
VWVRRQFSPILILLFKYSQGRREGVEQVIFAGARDSKGAQKSEIDLILGHILVFFGPEKCGSPQIWNPALKSRYKFGAQKGQKIFIGAPIFLPGPVYTLYGPEHSIKFEGVRKFLLEKPSYIFVFVEINVGFFMYCGVSINDVDLFEYQIKYFI